MSDEYIPTVICLTDQSPVQCKDIVRGSEATADLLPNYEDFRFPYKGSSMLCPTCGKPLAGKTREEEPAPEKDDDDKKKKPAKKPKPWEIHVENLRHEKESDAQECPRQKWKDNPNAKLMALVESAHQITWIRAWKEKASRPEGVIAGKDDMLETLEQDGTLPKLVHQISEEEDDHDAPKLL